MPRKQMSTFPRVNLLLDREQIRSTTRPSVRVRFWIALGASTTALLAVLAWLWLPTLLVLR